MGRLGVVLLEIVALGAAATALAAEGSQAPRREVSSFAAAMKSCSGVKRCARLGK